MDERNCHRNFLGSVRALDTLITESKHSSKHMQNAMSGALSRQTEKLYDKILDLMRSAYNVHASRIIVLKKRKTKSLLVVEIWIYLASSLSLILGGTKRSIGSEDFDTDNQLEKNIFEIAVIHFMKLEKKLKKIFLSLMCKIVLLSSI